MSSDKGVTCIYAREHRLHLLLYYYRFQPHEKIRTRKKLIMNDKEIFKTRQQTSLKNICVINAVKTHTHIRTQKTKTNSVMASRF